MDGNTISVIVTALLAAVAIFVPVVLVKLKAVKESLGFVQSVVDALEDNKVTADEVEEIKKELAEAKAAWAKK